MSEHVPDPTSHEPLALPATWTSLATAVIGVAVGYGLPVPDDARPGIIALAATVGPLLVWWWGRRRSWSGATVADRDRLRRPEQEAQR
jgi:hypothetical protein